MSQDPIQPLFDIAVPQMDIGQAAMAAALEKLVGFLTPPKMMLLLVFGAIELEDYAKCFGLQLQSVRNQVARRELPFVQHGSKKLVLVESAREMLRQREIKFRGSH